jgi:hypothetical protein
MAFVRAADCTEVIKRFHGLPARLESKVLGLKSKVGEPGEDRGRGRGRGRGGGQRAEGGRKSKVSGLKSKVSSEGAKWGIEDYELLVGVYRWALAPFTVWPVDTRGLALRLLEYVERGRRVDERTRLGCYFLGEPPPEEVCEMIAEYEHEVKAGNYEGLLAAPYKFDSMERELAENPEFKSDWARVKALFDVDQYRNVNGIIRRRPVQERNFRPADWKFSWETEAEQFRFVFDAFCHRWDLYGIEGRKIPSTKHQAPEKSQAPNSKSERGDRSKSKSKSRSGSMEEWEDRPLLMKLTANLTANVTLILVPRYWSFDPKRDVKWGAITRLHRMRGVQRQGPKLSAGRTERRQESERAGELWEEATEAGLKGQRRIDWVVGRMGWDARTDESRLRRLLLKR